MGIPSTGTAGETILPGAQHFSQEWAVVPRP